MTTPQEPDKPFQPEQPTVQPPAEPERPTAPETPAAPAEPSSPWPEAPQDATGYGAAPQAQPTAAAPQAQPYAQEYQTPHYAPPPGYEQAPGYAMPRRNPKTWMNITSFVTSLIGLSLVGVIFGHLGLSASKRGEAELKGLGIAGLVIGYLGIVLSIVGTIAFFWWLSTCDAGTGMCAGGFTWDVDTTY